MSVKSAQDQPPKDIYTIEDILLDFLVGHTDTRMSQWKEHDFSVTTKAIQEYIKQEQIKELEKCAEVILFHSGGVPTKEVAEKMWYKHIADRLEELNND